MKLPKLALGIHPTSRGFGWALFESPALPIFWGIVEIRTHTNQEALASIKTLLDRHQPEVLAMEQFEKKPAKRADRIRKLGSAVIALAKRDGIQTKILARASIGSAIVEDPEATRYDIAKEIARKLDVLKDRLPAKRKPWESEHPNLSLFSAAACALAWYAKA